MAKEPNKGPDWPDGNDQMLDIMKHAELMYGAATVGNWDFAAHELRAMMKRLDRFAETRPKYAEVVAEFKERCLGLAQAIKCKRPTEFNSAWNSFKYHTDHTHQRVGFGYIKVDDPTPPYGMLRLDLRPRPHDV